MHDRPDPPQLLEMVQQVLHNSVIPKLDPSTAYQVRVAANVLAIVRRQIERARADDSAERERLQNLLTSQETDLLVLNERLSDGLRDGTLVADDPRVLEHLWATTISKLAVDQPGYARFKEYTSQP